MFSYFSNTTVDLDVEPFVLFRISFWYYTAVGTIVTVLIGLIVSWFTNKNVPPVDPGLISPVVRRWMTKEKEYVRVENALELVTYNTKENNSAVK